MKFFKIAKKFRNDEDGAVTVDWVVLTAAIVGLGILVLNQVRTATGLVSTSIATQLGESAVPAANLD